MYIQDDQLNPFLKSSLNNQQYKVLPLAGDASNRRYYRIIIEDQSWVLMRWEPFNPNGYPFLSVLNHFASHQVNVPKVIAMAPEEGLVLLEDLGDLTLERKFWESQNRDHIMFFYKMAIDELVKIHHHSSRIPTDCTAFKMEFNTEKLMWEMNYAKEHLLKGLLKVDFSEGLSHDLNSLFLDLCHVLDKEPKKIVHRDYHSRNLMILRDKMFVIDFQDARLGTLQYDLVSLLKDSYVDLPEDIAQELMEYYLEQSKDFLPNNFSLAHFNDIYEYQSLQRCFKACGSFASFYMMRDDKRYLKYLPGTLRRVMKTLSYFPQYKLLSDLLIDSGALEKKYESL